jgi:hypothetical protein
MHRGEGGGPIGAHRPFAPHRGDRVTPAQTTAQLDTAALQLAGLDVEKLRKPVLAG